MTKAQIDFVLTTATYYGSGMDELKALFPEVDWQAEDCRRREAERKAWDAAREKSGAKPFYELLHWMADTYVKQVTKQLASESALWRRLGR